MSNNKLTNIAPSLSLGVGQANLTTSNLSTLTSPTQPLVASPMNPAQSLGTSLNTHTFTLPSANTLNTLNPINNSAQALTNLNTSNQTMTALTPSAQTMNSLNVQNGNSSSQQFLASPQVTNIVSLPQNFCFPSQPSQTSVSAANQPTALGVTWSLPMAAAAALNNNTISLNTNNIPLNSNTISLNSNTIPLNTNTIPLNAGNPISQQLVQTLSVGQQPTLCASLPQNIGFPLGQALLGMPNAGGASGGPFLSNLGQFSGIPSVIVGGQQSVLQGALVGNSSSGQGTPVQTLGALNPQSISFPLTAGPIITELPVNTRSSPQAPSPVTSASKDHEFDSQSTQQASQQSSCTVDSPQESQPSSIQENPKKSSKLPDPQTESQTPSVQQSNQDSSNPQEKSPRQIVTPDSEQPPSENMEVEEESPYPGEEAGEKDVCQDPLEVLPSTGCSSEVSSQLSSENVEGESAPPADEAKQEDTPSPDISTSVPIEKPEIEQLQPEEISTETEESCSGSVCIEDKESVSLVCSEDTSLKAADQLQTLDEQTVEDSSETNACLEDIKQEVEEIEDPGTDLLNDQTTADCHSSSVSSPVKTEFSVDNVDGSDPSTPQDHSLDSTQTTQFLHSLHVGLSSNEVHGLLTTVKEEAMEEEEDMVLRDSTPGSEDSLDSYYQRHSPSPMASLRLTRADTTTRNTTAATSYKRMFEDGEGAMDIKQFVPTETITVDADESELFWEDYLQETGVSSVPHTAFKHVECSLQSGFVKGMRVEVANKSMPGTYWVAVVQMTSEPLLRLRFEGYEEDSSKDFWCSLTSGDIHPAGWCAENGLALVPPEGVKSKHADWDAALQDILKTVPIAPSYLLDKTTGTSPIGQLKQGMRLEMQDCEHPTQVWLYRIIENVGGRLYLRIEGLNDEKGDFWAFYLHERLHPVGWGKERGYPFVPPKVLAEGGMSESEIQQTLETALKEAGEQNLPSDIFKDQLQVQVHSFKRGMKLEAVNPNKENHFGPATVVEIINKYYFVVEMDNLEDNVQENKIRFCCHSGTPTIFPIQWTAYKGIKLSAPPGWPKADFSWTEYLTYCRACEAPESCFHLDCEDHEFERGMKLEAVNPENPNQICAATITKIAAHLMWIHLDSSVHIIASHVEHVSSHNLFPVGWCASNGFQLQTPQRMGALRKRVAVVQPEKADGNQGKYEDIEERTYCPMIYINHKCFSGPLLSKSRISELPRSVGPGPLDLVMKEVLTKLINVAYKPSRVLKEIQQKGSPNRAMNQQILKAKHKNNSYRAVVEVCRSTAQLEDYCRQVCIKLECCSNLISPHCVGDNCPENCSRLTKTKYTCYGKKKRKIGRPPGGHTNLEDGPKRPAKKRKRQRLDMVLQKSHPPNGEEEVRYDEEVDDKDSETSETPSFDNMLRINDHKPHSASATAALSKRLKRKYTHHIPPPSEIRTRGAKLPRYSFERRTHKKILLSPAPSGVSGLRSKSLQTLHTQHKLKQVASAESYLPQSRMPSSLRSSLSGSCSSLSINSSFNASFSDFPSDYRLLPVDKNPLLWTVSDTVQFIKSTDSKCVADRFVEEEIDGQALLLLTLPAVQEHLHLKLGPAVKLCYEIERVRWFFSCHQYLNNNI